MYDSSTKGSDGMTKLERFAQLDGLLAEQDGMLQTSQAVARGIVKPIFYEYIKERKLEQVAHGIYVSEDTWIDAMFLLHLRCGQAVFSHESALFFHDLTDREPSPYAITVRRGYSTTRLKAEGLLLFSALLSFSTYQNKYAFDQNAGEGSGKAAVEIDKEIAAKYEGILTDEKVRQMMSDFAPTSDLHGLNAAYIYQNAMQSAAFSRFSDLNGNWNGLSVSDVFGNEEIKIGYVDGWLSTSRNMVRVFTALAFAVIIMLAPIFSGEYEGVDNIILTSKYGKTKCATAKVVAGILTAILTTALIVAFILFLALAFYGTEGLNCSILFAPSEYVEAFIPFNITCGTLLKYQILLAFTCTLSITGITLLLSAISKNQIVALIIAMAIFLFPILLPIPETNPLFRLVGLLPIYHVLAISLLSVEQMSNGMLYAIWAIPTALIFLGVGAGFSRYTFAKHQVL